MTLCDNVRQDKAGIIRDYGKLRSGTDVRGVAVADYQSNGTARLTNIAAYDIALAFVSWLKNKQAEASKNNANSTQRLNLAVGHDSRITATELSQAIITAFRAAGDNVHFCGMITTPAMFMMTQFPETNCDGVIMITASHHPYHMNGMKFFTKSGGITSKQLEEILNIASQNASNEKAIELMSREEILAYSKHNYEQLYADVLKEKIREFSVDTEYPLEGMRIVVDAGNGAAGFFARILESLGADTKGSQFLNPDGYFPNHVPNPEDKVAIKSIRDCVLRNKADLGIIFDTDGDRVGIVTSDGNEINRNRLIAVAATLLLDENQNKEDKNREASLPVYIITDSVTSEGLAEFIAAKGGVHVRYKRGYKNVIDKAAELCKEGKNASLAIETSGHAAFRENYFLDDGAYLAVRLIAKSVALRAKGGSISDLIKELREPVETLEARLTLTGERWKEDASTIIRELEEYASKHFILAKDSYEGVRAVVPSGNGWFLLRLSVHDPVMPLNIESDSEGGTKIIADSLKLFFSKYSCLDTTKLG